ncbi:C2 domain-containing protein [Halteromyces radiatus]|uniref:C2 domain-containing protein n=1 Tax=Halteromyces radiatus TaxID=101107 RepID=UPI00221F68E0|nr:C2 domain-containing protein [Halteromyces radiatus]KAI8099690.1 C2 domain-containing protein [Halteromyces radiatus]
MTSQVSLDTNGNVPSSTRPVEETEVSIGSNETTSSTPIVPGSFKKDNYGLPDSYKVGWTSFSELPNPGKEEHLEVLKKSLGDSTDALVDRYSTSRPDKKVGQHDLISQYLNEAYYGEWYHNAGVMLFAVASTWAQTKLGGGLMGCLVIGAFLGTYYQTSVRRLRRRMRDDIQRELMATRLLTDIESADWINNFMSRFWLIYEPGLSAQIISTADAILIESTPSFLDSIRLSTFTLGTKAPRIEGIKTYPRTEPNVVCMDWKLSFIPNDTSDLTKRDLDAKVNPKIILTVRVGKGMIGAEMPILLEDLSFSGNMRLKFKLYNEFPHIKSIEASFLEPPEIDYSLKPVGGETFGFDINMIPGLEPFIKEQIHATLGPMMYAPNVYTVDMTGNVASLDDVNGVLAVTLYSGSNLKAADFFGTLDPYISFHVDNIHNASLSESKAIEDTNNPKWNENHFILINNLNQSLYFQVMDRNFGRKDAPVGVANLELKEFEIDSIMEGKNLVVLRNGKSVGELKADVRYIPVSKPEKKEDGTIIPPPESDSGVLRLYVHECKQLGGDTRKAAFGLIKSDVNAYAVVKVNGHEKLRTKPFKRSFNPTWNKYVDVFVADKNKLDLGITIWDSSEFADDSLVGRWSSTLTQFQEQITKDSQDWWNLTDGAGRIHLSMTWKPVITTGIKTDISDGRVYTPPIGVIRLNLFGARDLKNVEALTGGKSDPYARVLSGMQVRAQTERIDDNLDPDWNTVLYVPVHSIHEDLIIEVMDYNDIQKDKSLGITEVILKDIIQETTAENGQVVYNAKDALDRTVDLTNIERTKSKGTIHYALSFHPTLELAKAAEEDDKEKKSIGEGDDVEAETKETAVGDHVSESKDDTPPTDTTNDAEKTLPEKDVHGELIKYTEEKKIDLIGYESGILSVTIQNIKLPQRSRAVVDVLVDSNDAQFTTSQLKGVELPYHETGDAFVKEMDFSRLVVNVRRWSDNEKEYEVIGYYTSPIRDIVRQIMSGDHDPKVGKEVNLLDCAGGVARLSFSFTPVIQFKLDPAESLENQGNLTVTALKASNLKAADRSGTSDPYVVFSVDDVKVHKTETIKKTLNPVFKNETFTVPVQSRLHSVLKATVFDWDQVGSDEFIGEALIPFSGEQLESFAAKDFEVNLTEGGTLKLRLLWQPQLLARKRTGTSLFSATTRIFTSAPGSALGAGKTFAGAGIGAGGKVLGAGFDAGGKVLGAGFDAIGSGIRGIGKIGSNGKKADSPVVPSTSSSGTAASTPDNHRFSTSTISSNSNGHETDSASISNADFANKTLQVSLIGARDLKAMDRGGTSDPYARVRIGNKVVYKTKHIKKTLTPQWNEKFVAKAENGKIDIKVKDHNTLSDVDIGGIVFDATTVLQTGQAFDGWLKLSPEGTGEIHVRIG